jgi:predicted AlkP superfamily pyrophosphatase or phosphodiesterase
MMSHLTTKLAAGVFLLAAAASAQKVVVIGVDGLSVEGVAHAPHIREFMTRSAWTLEARGVLPTLSSPNWASVIGGAGTEQHGITSNGWFRKMVEFRPVCQGPDGKFPTIFDVLRAQRPGSKIALFLEWGGFSELVPKSAPDVMRHEHGTARTADAAIQYWRQERPALLFIHLDNVDHAGHSFGWGSTGYHDAVREADAHVARILAALDPSTFVLITSDHGGTPHGHGKNSLAEIQIPWILAGPGVAVGRIDAPVNTFDTAVTLASIFGLKTPACWTGRVVSAAFRPVPAGSQVAAAGTDSAGPLN